MKKISVMIVDDEKLVLEDLATIVDWEAHGFEIVATAVNGRQALSKFQQLRPQVVFTDIKMPFMDGIELIEQLRARDKQTLLVVLTAYEDFTYAKTAIQHGIMDYVIKSTIDEAMASNLLQRIRARIENQGQVLDILKEKQIADFFYAANPAMLLPQQELFHKPYCYLLIEQDMPLNLPGDYNIDFIRYRKADAISVLLEGESPEYKIIAVSSTPRDQILLVLDISKASQRELQQICYQCALEKRRKLQARLQVEVSVYIVCKKMSLIELRQSYQSKGSYFYQRYMEYKEVYDLLDPCKATTVPTEEQVLNKKLIETYIEQGDEEGIKKYLEELFPSIASYTNLYHISRELYDLLKRYYKLMPECSDRDFLSFEKNWSCWISANRLKVWFISSFKETIQRLQSSYQQHYSKIIVQVIQYIYQHYSNPDLTLQAIADEVHLSVGYLCVLFKKETGNTLNNFITEVRINQAKKLLEDKKAKVYEISSAVGFQSSQYFSQVFYKQVGIYPNEFQKGKSKI